MKSTEHVVGDELAKAMEVIDNYVEEYGVFVASHILGVSSSHLYNIRRGKVPLTVRIRDRVFTNAVREKGAA